MRPVDVKFRKPNKKAKKTILGDGFLRSENVTALRAYITAAAGEIFTAHITAHVLTQVSLLPYTHEKWRMQRVQT